jgi:hypothetical protein
MGLVARLHRTSFDEAVIAHEDDAPEWSPRARTLTIVAAALASWAVVGTIVYLVGEAVSVWS